MNPIKLTDKRTRELLALASLYEDQGRAPAILLATGEWVNAPISWQEIAAAMQHTLDLRTANGLLEASAAIEERRDAFEASS